MDISERRQLTRYPMRTPIRFKAMGLAADKSEHFTEALNVSQGGFYFATSAALQVGMPIEATLRMPSEITGDKPKRRIAAPALFTFAMNPTATVASVLAPKSRPSFPCLAPSAGMLSLSSNIT